MENSLSQRTINRLTQYHTILRDFAKKNIENITSIQIAQMLNIDETQIRKDIKSIDCRGKCKVGYSILELKSKIENVLDCNYVKRAFVVGAGNLGLALSKYSKFSEFGLEIAGIFDSDEKKIGKKIGDLEIYDIEKIHELSKIMNVNIAILTTPNKVAQMVTDKLVKSGIKYIWNFAPSILNVPDYVTVWNENLIGSFLQFCAISKIH